MVIILALVIAMLVVAFVAVPFFVTRPPTPADDGMPERLRDLLAEKETLYAAIQELDFDLKSGKLSAKDHQALRERQENLAAAVLQRIDEAQERGAAAPRKGRRDRKG